VAIGKNAGATATSQYSVAIGDSAQTGLFGVSIGNSATANAKHYATAVGRSASVTENSGTAVGFAASAGLNSVAIGSNTVVVGQNSVGIGYDADCTTFGVAIGGGIKNTGAYSIVLGSVAYAATRTNANTHSFSVFTEDTTPLIQIHRDNDSWIDSTGNFGFNTMTPGASVHIKGAGATSATKSLLIEDSAGQDILTLTDDGVLRTDASNNSGTLANASLKVGGGSNGAICFTDANHGIYIGTTGAQIDWGGGNIVLGIGSLGFELTTGKDAPDYMAIFATTHRSIHYKLGASSTANGDGHAFFVKDSAASPSGGNDQRVFTIGNRPTSGNIVPCSFENITGLVVGANVSSLDASAILQSDSTTQGFLPPRMTTLQRAAIVLPATGLIVYNTTTSQWEGNSGTPASPSWVILG